MRQYSFNLILVTFALATASCRSQGVRGNMNSEPSNLESVESFESKLSPIVSVGDDSARTATLLERMKHYQTPGVSVAVIRNYKVVLNRGYGFTAKNGGLAVTADTAFQAASISKPVTAMAVLALVEAGKLQLDSDVGQYLKNWSIPFIKGQTKHPITLQSILNHSAGINIDGFPGYELGHRLPTLEQILNGSSPANTPPVRVELPAGQFKYSGGGYTVLQKAISDVSQEPFPIAMNQLVFNPLQIRRASFEPSPAAGMSIARGYHWDESEVPSGWHVYPELAAAGLWTSAKDLALLMIDLQLSASKGQGKILTQEMARKMLTSSSGSPMGLGMFVKKEGEKIYFQHSGWNEGYVGQIVGDTEGNGLVILTNGEQFGLILEILDAVGSSFRWPGYPRARAKAVPISSEVSHQFSGKYSASDGETWQFVGNNGRMFALVPNELLYQPVEVFQSSESDFFAVAPSMKFRFVKGKHKQNEIDLIEGEGQIKKLIKMK